VVIGRAGDPDLDLSAMSVEGTDSREATALTITVEDGIDLIFPIVSPTSADWFPFWGRSARSAVCLEIGNKTRLTQFAFNPNDTTGPARGRRLALLQSLLALGRLDYLAAYLDRFAESSLEEPISLCLAGYAAIRLNRGEVFSDLPEQFVRTPFFPGTIAPDVYYLLGEACLRDGDFDSARAHFRSALDYGLPRATDGVRGLATRVRRYRIAHPRAELLLQADDLRVADQVWAVRFNGRRVRPAAVPAFPHAPSPSRVEVQFDAPPAGSSDYRPARSPDDRLEITLVAEPRRLILEVTTPGELDWVVLHAWDHHGELLARGFVGLHRTARGSAGRIRLGRMLTDLTTETRWWLSVEPALGPELCGSDEYALEESLGASDDPRSRAVLYRLLAWLRSPERMGGVPPPGPDPTWAKRAVPVRRSVPDDPIPSSLATAALLRTAPGDRSLRRQLTELSEQIPLTTFSADGEEEPTVVTAIGGEEELSWDAPTGLAPGMTLTGIGPGKALGSSGEVRFTGTTLSVSPDRFPANGSWYVFTLSDAPERPAFALKLDIFALRWEASPGPDATPYEFLERGLIVAARKKAAALGWAGEQLAAFRLAAAARMAVLLEEAVRQFKEEGSEIPNYVTEWLTRDGAGRVRAAIGKLASQLLKA
jgi:hypothetical protein